MEYQDKLYELFENVGLDLNLMNISETSMIKACDSLQYVSLLCDIEDAFGIEIPEALYLFDEEKTIKNFLNEIQEVIAKDK